MITFSIICLALGLLITAVRVRTLELDIQQSQHDALVRVCQACQFAAQSHGTARCGLHTPEPAAGDAP